MSETVSTAAPHSKILDGANAVAEARSHLELAATLVSYNESLVLNSLARQFVRLETALHRLSEVFERRNRPNRQLAQKMQQGVSAWRYP